MKMKKSRLLGILLSLALVLGMMPGTGLTAFAEETGGKQENPAAVEGAASVVRGGNTVDLTDNVTLNGAAGAVSYAISGETNGCSLDGSVLTSGESEGTVTVNIAIAEDDNYNALSEASITVTITEKGTQTITAEDVTAVLGDTNKSVSATTDGDGAISYAVKEGSEDYIEVNAATGALTTKKTGTATIIVTAAETNTFAQATKEVTVTVNEANAATDITNSNNNTSDEPDNTLENVDEQKPVLKLGLMRGMSLTVHAAEYTTLNVGDVLHVGDTINSQTIYRYATGCTLTGMPYTLARGDINLSTGDFTESDNGGYYFFKNKIGKIEYDPDFQSYYMNKIVFAATGISDGLYVKSVGNLSLGARDISFAVHQGAAVANVTLNPSTAQTIDVDEKVSFTATVEPNDAVNKKVKWSTNNSNVALYSNEACTTPVGTDATDTLTVYAKGVSAGSATVTVTATNGTDVTTDDKSANCAVTVNATHVHSFTYSAEGETITAACANADNNCTLNDGNGNHIATLTIAAPTSGNDATVTVSPAGAITGYEVKYQTKNGSTWGDETTTAPTGAGFHKASVKLTGTDNKDATASVIYGNNCITYATVLANGSISGATGATVGATISPAITPDEGYQLDTLTVTPAEGSGVSTVTVNGGTFVMPEANVTVSATFKEITYTVTVDGAKATVTDSLPTPNTFTAELANIPADKTYDGEPVDLTTAFVQKSDGFPDNKVTVGGVSFKDQNNNTVTTAANVGVYTASATVGDKTISKAFTINGQATPITYVKTTKSGITKTTTNQYIPLVSNPNGITLLKEGRTYVASGNIEIGALVYKGNNVKLILCKNTKVTIYAGIYHIGSSLEIYTEEGADGSELIVKGTGTLSSMTNYSDFVGQTISDENAALSGTIGVYGGKLTVEQGNFNLVADDISITLGAGMSSNGLSGGTENSDGSVTYGKAAFANLTSLAVKPVAVVKTAPTANTLTYTGSAQELVTAGEAEGGTMYYAVTTENTAPADSLYTTSIPTKTEAGTYYVWYKAKGDADHSDSTTFGVLVTIEAPIKPIEGNGFVWHKGSSDNSSIRFSSQTEKDLANVNSLESVSVDEKDLVLDRDYKISKGSVIVTFTKSYLETLGVGKHNVVAKFKFNSYSKDVNATFTVAPKSSGGGSTPKKDNVVTCQMAGFPANYAWNEAAKACQPGYLDAGGNFHSYSNAKRSTVPNTSDNGNLTFYTIAMFLMTLVAFITAKTLTEDSRL